VPVSYPNCGNGQPRIELYDVSNAATIVDFDGPLLTGQHSGANNSATLTVAGQRFPASLIGAKSYNITDGSSTTITAVGGTNQDTITGVLAGGTDNDWDTGDVYYIKPLTRLFCEPFCFKTPAGCTQIQAQMLNNAGEGVLTWHQVEIQPNLLANGDHESLTGGNPDLITGWTNNGLDAGDTEAEAAIIHSGSQSLEWNSGAVLGEGQYETITTTSGKYIAFGGWTRGDGTDGFRVGDTDGNQALAQYSASVYRKTTPVTANWLPTSLMLRAIDANPELQIEADAIAGDGHTDDFYAIEMNDVSLTATPASEANSAEGSGIRVDGRDGLTQTTYNGTNINAILTATSGHIRFDWTPRHGDGDFQKWQEGGADPLVVRAHGDASNYIMLEMDNNNDLLLEFNDSGGAQNNSWTPSGAIVAGTTYLMEIRYTGSQMELLVDGVQRILVSQPVNFSVIPATLYWGSDNSEANQGDAVFAAPTP